MTKVFRICIFYILILSLVGCSSNSETELESKQTYESYNENYVIDDEFTEEFYQNMTITITDVNEDERTGNVVVTFPDLQSIYKNHRDEIVASSNEEDMQKILIENFGEEIIEESFEGLVYKEDSTWRLVDTEEVEDMLVIAIDNFLKEALKDVELPDVILEGDFEGVENENDVEEMS